MANVTLLPKQITHATIFRVLIAGFLLVILLLLAAGFVSVRNIRSIQESVAGLVSQELVTARLIDEIQHEQAALSAVFYKLSRDPQFVDREKILSELDAADDRIEQVVASVQDSKEAPLWNALQKSLSEFSDEARRLLSLGTPTTLLSRELFRRHQDALAIMVKLAAASYAKASASKKLIDERPRTLMRHSVILLGTCVLFAILGAILTVRFTTRLFHRMEWQTSELSRVSWHMLENQETTARRFSHELHDELGQSLTALKANLSALQARDPADRQRVEDCLRLANEAIRNVRELSQLLHPTILDDFGLDAGLRWLSEGFTHRTGIEAEYASEFSSRLPDETEIHLFRICQEALTNVARHSGASQVRIHLRSDNANVYLSISDNGRGLPEDPAVVEQGLGLIGMRARARGAGGELAIHPREGGGLVIDAQVPARGMKHEEDPNPVSR